MPKMKKNKDTDGKKWYRAYLRSAAWKRRRKAVIARQGGRCMRCPNPVQEVHHRTYKRIGREEPGDLVGLCRPCHLRHHGGRPKRNGAADVLTDLQRRHGPAHGLALFDPLIDPQVYRYHKQQASPTPPPRPRELVSRSLPPHEDCGGTRRVAGRCTRCGHARTP